MIAAGGVRRRKDNRFRRHETTAKKNRRSNGLGRCLRQQLVARESKVRRQDGNQQGGRATSSR
jgi:hypothetical protein